MAASVLCKESIKDKFGARVICTQAIVEKEGCPNSAMHLTKYKSGFCGIGAHEGTNPRNVNSHPVPTCLMWQTCACPCHETFDQMAQLSETIRSANNFSSYTPDKGDFIMPSPTELALQRASSNATPSTAPEWLESPDPINVPATLARSYADTPSGRSAPGELESQVKWACDVWRVDQEGKACTPGWVSAEIGKKYGIKPPSVGAIDAVFNRWLKIDFAVIAKKPTRFVSYTQLGIELTLDGCKEKYRRANRK